MKKIVVVGGHLTPAQALIEKLEPYRQIKIYFFGRKRVTSGSTNISAEYEQTSSLPIEFKNILAGRVERHISPHFVPSLIKIPVGFVQSFIHLLLIRPQLVVSFGGSLSFPVVFSAWLLGIDAITHEQAVVPGFSNRLNAIFVSKIYLTWPQTARYFPNEKTKVIGNLIREGILADNQPLHALPKNTLVVMGGNQGSHFLNQFIFTNIKALKNYNIIHSVGMANFKGDWQKAKSIKDKNYVWYEFIKPQELRKIYKQSDFILARAGANTIWEMAILKKIGILVPLPHSAGGEQEQNARILENAGSVLVINQGQASDQSLLNSLEAAKSNYKQMQSAAQALSLKLPKNAASILASDVVKMLSD